MGPMMACILMTVLPIIIVYLVCQKYIIKGVMAELLKARHDFPMKIRGKCYE